MPSPCSSVSTWPYLPASAPYLVHSVPFSLSAASSFWRVAQLLDSSAVGSWARSSTSAMLSTTGPVTCTPPVGGPAALLRQLEKSM